jgi:hypothetical protein
MIKFNDFEKLNEEVNLELNKALHKKYDNPIDIQKLKEYSKAIGIICNGEYGNVYYNESENHIFVCLGDSNPFDEKYLEQFIKDAVAKKWDVQNKIKVTIENECSPKLEEGWITIN